MTREQENKAVVGRWFNQFWGSPWNPEVIDELTTPDMLLQYSLHAPRRGRDDVRSFMIGFREAFPDLNFWGTADLIAEGDYVVGRWRVAARIRGRHSAIFLQARSRHDPAEGCASPARPYYVSRTAGSRRRSDWMTA